MSSPALISKGWFVRDILARKQALQVENPPKWVQCGHLSEDEFCDVCCEHADMDGGQCLDCGSDRTEHLMAAAYDRCKYGGEG